MNECLFCRIVKGEIPADVVYESENFLAFKDINPQAPTHVLVIPKEHYATLDDLPAESPITKEMLLAVQKTAANIGVSGRYKALTNCGEEAGQVIPHLHFHILAGKKFVP